MGTKAGAGLALFLALGLGGLTGCEIDQPMATQALSAPDFQRGADWPTDSNPPYSALVVHGETVHLAGTLGFTPGTRDLPDGVEAQAGNALAAIEASLAQVGAAMTDVVSCTCYLADMDDYAAFNAVYAEAFPVNPPARTTVGVAALPLGAAVEITCQAALLAR